MKTCGVYEVRVGEWFYIGSSKNVERRIKDHSETLGKGAHKNKLLQRAYNECGTFDWRLLLACEESEQYAQEQRLIDERWGDPFMANISPLTLIDDPAALSQVIGKSTRMAYEMNPALGRAISERNRQIWSDPEHRARREASVREGNAHPARRAKISARMKDHWSDEQNRIDQAAAQQVAWDEEKRQEHAGTMRQVWSSEATRKKASDSAKQRCQDPGWQENQRRKQAASWQDPVIREKRLEGQRRTFEKRKQEKLNKAKEG